MCIGSEAIKWTPSGCRKKQGQYLCGKCFSGMGRGKSRSDNTADLLWLVYSKRGWDFQCIWWCPKQTGCQGNPERRDCVYPWIQHGDKESRFVCKGTGRAGENPYGFHSKTRCWYQRTGQAHCSASPWLSVEAVWSGTAGRAYFKTGKPEWQSKDIPVCDGEHFWCVYVADFGE